MQYVCTNAASVASLRYGITFVAYAAMLCDLDKTVHRSCVLQSPLIPSTLVWDCMKVSYELSSSDVKLKLDLLDGGVSFEAFVLPANQTAIWIENPNRGTDINIQLTASRHLVSTADYEDAQVTSVAFLPCQSSIGMLKENYTVDTVIHITVSSLCYC